MPPFLAQVVSGFSTSHTRPQLSVMSPPLQGYLMTHTHRDTILNLLIWLHSRSWLWMQGLCKFTFGNSSRGLTATSFACVSHTDSQSKQGLQRKQKEWPAQSVQTSHNKIERCTFFSCHFRDPCLHCRVNCSPSELAISYRHHKIIKGLTLPTRTIMKERLKNRRWTG